MHSVKIHEVINSLISIFFRLGLWHREHELTIIEKMIMIFYSIYYFLFPISLMAGAFSTDNKDESIFLIESAIMASVVSVKWIYIIWRKKEILELLNRVGVHSLEDHEEFTLVNDMLKNLMRFARVYISLVYFVAVCIVMVMPFLGGEKKLFFNIGFPLDWRNNEIAFWIAFVFVFTEVVLTVIVCLFSVLMWYSMFNCAIRYEVLGHKIRNMGVVRQDEDTANKRTMSDVEKQNLYLQDLISAIKSHKDIKE